MCAVVKYSNAYLVYVLLQGVSEQCNAVISIGEIVEIKAENIY